MELYIDGLNIQAEPGKSLRQLSEELGFTGQDFSARPIAAKIAGEIFNLNYIPVRNETEGLDRPSIRRAMAASNGQVQLLRYTDPAGKDVYSRTAQFVLFLAIHQLWPRATAKMDCFVCGSAGRGQL